MYVLKQILVMFETKFGYVLGETLPKKNTIHRINELKK